MPELTKADLVVVHSYRGKRPRRTLTGYGDRTLFWIGNDQVQYDSPTVADGRQYPRASVEAFQKWAAKDVTEEVANAER